MQTVSAHPTLTSGTQQGPVSTRGCWEENAGPRVLQRQPRCQPPQNTWIKQPQETAFQLRRKVPRQSGILGEAKAKAFPLRCGQKLKKNPEMGGKRQVLGHAGELAEPAKGLTRCVIPNQIVIPPTRTPPSAPNSKATRVGLPGSGPKLLSHFCHKGEEREKADVMCTFPPAILGF